MAESKKSVKSLIYTLVMLAFMAMGWIVAPFGGLSEFGVKVLGIFIGMMWGWIFIGLIWPSLLGMLMLTMCGLGTAKEVFAQGYGSEIVLLVIFFSVFTGWLEEIGLTNTLTQWMMTRKVSKGKPYLTDFYVIFSDPNRLALSSVFMRRSS